MARSYQESAASLILEKLRARPRQTNGNILERLNKQFLEARARKLQQRKCIFEMRQAEFARTP